METKERLMETLERVLGTLKIQIQLGSNNPNDIVQLSAEIRRVVSLIAELDRE